MLVFNYNIILFQESERKTYNPRSFCKVYTMDQQLLNTGEQKDMAEFFIDLVSKLEEMTPELKTLVKTLFGGVISNNVVSLVRMIMIQFYIINNRYIYIIFIILKKSLMLLLIKSILILYILFSTFYHKILFFAEFNK